MSQFVFLHEINDFVYAIEDCSNGSADAIKRGEVIEYEFAAVESSTSTPSFAMSYKIRFDGDTFTTEVEVPFNTLSLISLTEGLDETSYDQVGSPVLAGEGSFTPGDGYAFGDVLTMSDGSIVTVNDSGPVGSPVALTGIGEFTVTTKGGNVTVGTALTQLSNAGSPATGVGFTLTPGSGTVDDDGFLVLETETGSTLFSDKADAVTAYAADLA